MQKTRGIARTVLAAALASGLAACTPIERNHGYVPTEQDLEQIVVGVDTQDTVATTVGAPSVAGVMRDDAWYYISSRWQTRGAFAPKELERQVIAVSFDGNGVVTNIERFGLENGRVIALNRRVTDDNIKGVSFIRQLLGNIGNFTADQIFDE